MELANVIVRLGGDVGNAVPKGPVTPAEILVLKYIHGSDAIVDVRPHPDFEDKTKTSAKEFDRLSSIYDRGAGEFVSKPGEERGGILSTLFPGAMKQLPKTLAEIGYEFGPAEGVAAPAAAPEEPEVAADTEGSSDAAEAAETADAAGEATVAEQAAE